MNIIPCIAWVRQGVAKSTPDKVQLDKEELRRIIEETEERLDGADDEEEEDIKEEEEEEVEGATAAPMATKSKTGKSKVKEKDKGKKRKHEPAAENDNAEEDIVDKYGLDDYDEPDDDDSNPLKGLGNLTIHASNEDDPYITLKDEVDSDEEDFEIKPTDNLIVVGRAENDMCSLEVHVYNEDLGNLYCHHDIILPSFPLAVEWLNYDAGDSKTGNFVAVGSMEPTIDIWDLDVVDSLEPVCSLGARVKKKKFKKKGCYGHTDAVLDLSWNSLVRTALASASADFTVALWDLSDAKVVSSITEHKEKVQCVSWHPFEAQLLLSGSFDHTVKLFDCKSPSTNHTSWDVGGEVEQLLWNHFSPMNFYASTEKGHIYYMDSRKDKPIFTLSAHNDSVTGLRLSSQVPGLLVTSSSDGFFKVWDVHDDKPSLVMDRDLKLGALYCVDNCVEAPYVFAIGGEKEMKVWDIRENPAVMNHFHSRGTVDMSTKVHVDSVVKKEETESSVAMETSSSETKTKKKKKKRKKKKPQE